MDRTHKWFPTAKGLTDEDVSAEMSLVKTTNLVFLRVLHNPVWIFEEAFQDINSKYLWEIKMKVSLCTAMNRGMLRWSLPPSSLERTPSIWNEGPSTRVRMQASGTCLSNMVTPAESARSIQQGTNRSESWAKEMYKLTQFGETLNKMLKMQLGHKVKSVTVQIHQVTRRFRVFYKMATSFIPRPKAN